MENIDLFDDFFNVGGNDLGADQARAYEVIKNNDNNYYVGGNAGSGKSFLLKHVVENLNKNVAVVAPTGIAALNVGGATIHSFFKFPPFGILNERDIKHHGSNEYNMLKKLEVLVTDESSMIRADLLEGINLSLRKNKGVDLPFGGVKLLMFGDLNQLPPVVKNDDIRELSMKYRSPFFFDAPSIRQNPLHKIYLNQIFRQKDQAFIDILNKLKNRRLTASDLQIINDKCYRPDYKHDRNIINLCTINRQADIINHSMLESVEAEEHTFEGVFCEDFKETNAPVPITLKLREGARVMFRNNDMDKRWYNGTIGTIVKINKDNLKVELDDGIMHIVNKYTWENKKYKLDKLTDKMMPTVVGTYTQFPCCLGWALSIHKSQGTTLEKAHIDMGDGAFVSGQTYVALSRLTSMEYLTLSKPLQMSDIIYDQRIDDFLNS